MNPKLEPHLTTEARYALICCIVAGGVAVISALLSHIDLTMLAAVSLLLTAFVAFKWGRVPAVVTVLACIAGCDLLAAPPLMSLAVAEIADGLALGALGAFGIATAIAATSKA